MRKLNRRELNGLQLSERRGRKCAKNLSLYLCFKFLLHWKERKVFAKCRQKTTDHFNSMASVRNAGTPKLRSFLLNTIGWSSGFVTYAWSYLHWSNFVSPWQNSCRIRYINRATEFIWLSSSHWVIKRLSACSHIPHQDGNSIVSWTFVI